MQHQRRYEIGACRLANAVSRGKGLTTAGEFHGRTNRSAGFSALPLTEPMGGNLHVDDPSKGRERQFTDHLE